jgi:small GTP-binding protein
MSSQRKPPCCKVVLLGDSGVGKTCIISRYISGAFDQNSPSTNGASYASKLITFENLNKTISLDIWDTAGQEKYKSLTKFFYKDAVVAILVYDITKRETFEDMKDYWYGQLQEFGSKNIIKGVAGNKCDMYEKEQVNENEGKQFAEQIGAFFEITSAKNNTGITDLFMHAANKFVDPNYKGKTGESKEENNPGNGSIKLEEKEHKTQKKKSWC